MSNPKRNRKRGKRAERKIAELLNAIRVGILGGEDVFHEKFSIEVKSREKFVGEKWYEQAIKNNKRNKIPIVVIHLHKKHYKNSLVLLSLSDFLKLIEKIDRET